VSLIISQLLHVGSRQHCKAGCPLLQRHVIQILLSIGPVPVGTQDVTVGTQDVTVGTQDSTVGTQDDVQVKQMHSHSNFAMPFDNTTFAYLHDAPLMSLSTK